MRKDQILITGANGQIGSVLTQSLRERYGNARVLATDIRPPQHESGPFELLDILDRQRWATLIDRYQVTQIYHLAAILSANGEQRTQKAWEVHKTGLLNALELARDKALDKLFFPSSIAVFGPEGTKEQTPQEAVLNPTTVYGISKAAGENWCYYYHQRHGIAVRSLRYPGIVGYQGMPGGGTTDYAVDIYHQAVREQPFRCFLSARTTLPMIYMPDAIRATIDLMEAPQAQIGLRCGYNLAGMSFYPADIARDIEPPERADDGRDSR